jgi:hypothetical protein
VARPDQVFDVVVLFDVDVLAVDVIDDHAHRGARGESVAHSSDDGDLVGLEARRVEFALSRPALVELLLDHGVGQFDAGRHAIDNGQQRLAVGFAAGGNAEHASKGVADHRQWPFFEPSVARLNAS